MPYFAALSVTSPENEVIFSVIGPDAVLTVASVARSTLMSPEPRPTLRLAPAGARTVTLPRFPDVMTPLRSYTENTNHTGELE